MRPEVELLLFVCSAVLFALVPGYVLWLRLAARKAPRSFPEPLSRDTRVDIIVPVRDEARLIEDKLRNLAALVEPPAGMDFWIVDGGSRDGTPEIVERFGSVDARVHLLRDVPGGKVAQVDAALGCCEAEWVVVTDADARLPRHAILEMLAVAAGSSDIHAVGVPVVPQSAHMLDRVHWRELNSARAAEARAGCAALVTGPCYLFRRELLPRGFADGVVADDVHVAMTAAACGKRVGFAESAVVAELRSPSSLRELFRHKVRKADAYLREVVRFIPLLPGFHRTARAVFLWRAAQMIVFPVAALGAGVALLDGLMDAGLASFVQVAALIAVAVVADSVVSASQSREARLAPAMALSIVLAAVLLVVLVTAPFTRRTARYPKVSGVGHWREET